jgi:hypothetical protein
MIEPRVVMHPGLNRATNEERLSPRRGHSAAYVIGGLKGSLEGQTQELPSRSNIPASVGSPSTTR